MADVLFPETSWLAGSPGIIKPQHLSAMPGRDTNDRSAARRRSGVGDHLPVSHPRNTSARRGRLAAWRFDSAPAPKSPDGGEGLRQRLGAAQHRRLGVETVAARD